MTINIKTVLGDIVHTAQSGNISHSASANIQHQAEQIIHTAVAAITHQAGTNITHTAGAGIIHNAIAAINHSSGVSITHSAPQIQHQASAMQTISSPLMKIAGANKNFLPAASTAVSSFSSLSSTLASVRTAFSSVTGLGGMISQMSSITSSFSSLQSLASGFSGITSLSSALSSFQGLTSQLNSITGGTTNSGGGSSGGSSGTLSSLDTTSNTAMGGIGAISAASYSMGPLATTSSFSGITTNLNNLSTWPASIAPVATLLGNNQNMTSAANTIVALQNMGIQQSQPGSTTSVSSLAAIMQDIYNLTSTVMAPITFTLSGTKTTGDTVSLTIANPSLTGSPKTYTYTAVSASTLSTIANGLHALMAADSALTAASITSSVSGSTITIIGPPPTSCSSAVTGAFTEFVTITSGDVTQAGTNASLLEDQMTGSQSDISAVIAAISGLP
jgi:hypothetical protein